MHILATVLIAVAAFADHSCALTIIALVSLLIVVIASLLLPSKDKLINFIDKPAPPAANGAIATSCHSYIRKWWLRL